MAYDGQLAAIPSTARLYTLGEFEITALGRRRRVDIYLPLGYDRSRTMRYPVMYMWDGQNLFEPHRSFSGAWRIGASLDLLVAAGELPPTIVVAIDHGGPERISEQSPWKDERFKGRGEGEAFLGWVTDHLKPTIDQVLRTRPEAAYTAVAGSSMGGLTSLYALYHAPHVFGRAAAFSPSLHIAKGAIFDFVRSKGRPEGTRLYLDVGAREIGRPERSRPITEAARRLDALFRSQGWQPGHDYKWLLDPRGTHSESCWSARFPRAMRFLWGDLV